MQTGIVGHTGYYSDADQSPGNKNALISSKTIHCGAFMVGINYLSEEQYWSFYEAQSRSDRSAGKLTAEKKA